MEIPYNQNVWTLFEFLFKQTAKKLYWIVYDIKTLILVVF